MTDDRDRTYVLISLRVKDDDTAERDPEDVAKEIADLGLDGVAETRAAFGSDGVFWPYGPGYVSL